MAALPPSPSHSGRHLSPPPASPRRRLSHPTMAFDDEGSTSYLSNLAFPSVSGLRAALLGYIGEAENVLREKLGVIDPNHPLSPANGSNASVSSPSSEDETDNEQHWARAAASALPEGSSSNELRHRRPGAAPNGSPVLGNGLPTRPRPGRSASAIEADARVLDYLSALREDVAAYVPLGLSGTLGAQREWLRNLPGRLQAVELGLCGTPTAEGAGAWPDPVSASSRAVQGARRRVIEVVHALLPPDDWGGWERLGWEEGEDGEYAPRALRGNHLKSCSLDEGRAVLPNRGGQGVDGDDDNDDEPEYLFPNRTPGPARAIERRRLRRSKSLGSADYPIDFMRPTFLDWTVRDIASVVDDDGDDDDLAVEAHLETSTDEGTPEPDDKLCDVHGVHLGAPQGPTVAEALIASADGTRLIEFKHLPFWWRNNQYIHTGYRFIPLGRAGPIPLIKSAFQLHNETVNIHSHFIPTILIYFVIIPLIIWKSPLPDPHWIDTAMLVSYLLAATSCLSSSAGWHVLSGCSSRRWFEWGACVDYIGISWLIAFSFNTVVYNAYYCSPKTVIAYTSVNIAFGGLGSYLPFQKWFNQRKNKPWRILFFICLNMAMVAPIVQLFYQHGYDLAVPFVAPFLYSVLTYIAGLVCYSFHFPECAMPGKFDRWGASHQLWHMCIVGAIALHYRAIFVAYDHRWGLSCSAPGEHVTVPAAITALLFGPQAVTA